VFAKITRHVSRPTHSTANHRNSSSRPQFQPPKPQEIARLRYSTLSALRDTARSIYSCASSIFLFPRARKRSFGSDNPNTVHRASDCFGSLTLVSKIPLFATQFSREILCRRKNTVHFSQPGSAKNSFFTLSSRGSDRTQLLCTTLSAETNCRLQHLTT
jgi:hypothetical protein